MRGVAAVALLLCLVACDLESPQDKQMRERLTGAWMHAATDGERKVPLAVKLAADGSFEFKAELPDRTEVRSGRWYVTEGYYKLKYDRIDGKPLSSSKIVYFTCRLLKVESTSFTCRDDSEKLDYVWARAP
jgi:hypothetical protein